ncbi:MAG: protein-L-isoaspartate(D-aspartate) O-methyltransferase [Methylohalobius sp. ZOD2]
MSKAIWLAFLLPLAASCWAKNEDEAARERLLNRIEQDFRDTAAMTGKGALDPRVKNALREVPRHLFVDPAHRHQAYKNRPLPIGYGQTISQPYIVALMTALLEPQPDHTVLEIGTGSGYQAAVLSRLVKKVYTVEIIEPLAEQARNRLRELGYANVEVRLGDGYHGWKEHAPFDGIVVTAAASHIPQPLVQQLKPGGRMIIPVGGHFLTQSLLRVEKDRRGQVITRQLLPVRFVPLTGEH